MIILVDITPNKNYPSATTLTKSSNINLCRISPLIGRQNKLSVKSKLRIYKQVIKPFIWFIKYVTFLLKCKFQPILTNCLNNVKLGNISGTRPNSLIKKVNCTELNIG